MAGGVEWLAPRLKDWIPDTPVFSAGGVGQARNDSGGEVEALLVCDFLRSAGVRIFT